MELLAKCRNLQKKRLHVHKHCHFEKRIWYFYVFSWKSNCTVVNKRNFLHLFTCSLIYISTYTIYIRILKRIACKNMFIQHLFYLLALVTDSLSEKKKEKINNLYSYNFINVQQQKRILKRIYFLLEFFKSPEYYLFQQYNALYVYFLIKE